MNTQSLNLEFFTLPLNIRPTLGEKSAIFWLSLVYFKVSKGILWNPKTKQKIIIESSNSTESAFYTTGFEFHDPSKSSEKFP